MRSFHKRNCQLPKAVIDKLGSNTFLYILYPVARNVRFVKQRNRRLSSNVFEANNKSFPSVLFQLDKSLMIQTTLIV